MPQKARFLGIPNVRAGRTSAILQQKVAKLVQDGEPFFSFSSIRQYVERLNASR
jgi:hypothetical protein